jgi:toxin ParE1/3/4
VSESSRPYRLLREAQTDVTTAFDWYESQQSGLGFEFLGAVADGIDAALHHPEHYPVLEAGIRRVLLRGFPYGVFFITDETEMLVTRVTHARRDPRRWRR